MLTIENGKFYEVAENGKKIELSENNPVVIRYRAKLLKEQIEKQQENAKKAKESAKLQREELKKAKELLKQLEPAPEKKLTRLTRLTCFFIERKKQGLTDSEKTLSEAFLSVNTEENVREVSYSIGKLFEVLRGFDISETTINLPTSGKK